MDVRSSGPNSALAVLENHVGLPADLLQGVVCVERDVEVHCGRERHVSIASPGASGVSAAGFIPTCSLSESRLSLC